MYNNSDSSLRKKSNWVYYRKQFYREGPPPAFASANDDVICEHIVFISEHIMFNSEHIMFNSEHIMFISEHIQNANVLV